MKDKVSIFMPETDEAFNDFVKNRSEETYKHLIETFVWEVMTTEATVGILATSKNFMEFVDDKSKLATAIVRDPQGRPYTALLTSSKCNRNNAEVMLEYKAMDVFTNVLTDSEVFGLAINPWDGGAPIPKQFIMEEVEKLRPLAEE